MCKRLVIFLFVRYYIFIQVFNRHKCFCTTYLLFSMLRTVCEWIKNNVHYKYMNVLTVVNDFHYRMYFRVDFVRTVHKKNKLTLSSVYTCHDNKRYRMYVMHTFVFKMFKNQVIGNLMVFSMHSTF